jgi:hypothetical protein
MRGGSNRVSNLTIACPGCNDSKGTQTAAEFGYPQIQAQARTPLKDAAAINATRWKLYETLQASGLPLEVGTGGRTKHNRIQQGYPKTHWADAACVGKSGEQVFIRSNTLPLTINAVGRQSRQMCRVDKFGFPRTKSKQARIVKGFQTGDMVRADVPQGKHHGVHTGRVAVRANGYFRVGKTDGVSWRHCRILHRSDGYQYEKGEALLPAATDGVSAHSIL